MKFESRAQAVAAHFRRGYWKIGLGNRRDVSEAPFFIVSGRETTRTEDLGGALAKPSQLGSSHRDHCAVSANSSIPA